MIGRLGAVAVRIEPLGCEPGQWCTVCALPSAFLFSWSLVNLQGEPIAAGQHAWCPECRT